MGKTIANYKIQKVQSIVLLSNTFREEYLWNAYRLNLSNTVPARMNRVTKKAGAVNACIITEKRANCLDAFLIKNLKRHTTALSQIL
jgi:hypothetical protein